MLRKSPSQLATESASNGNEDGLEMKVDKQYLSPDSFNQHQVMDRYGLSLNKDAIVEESADLFEDSNDVWRSKSQEELDRENKKILKEFHRTSMSGLDTTDVEHALREHQEEEAALMKYRKSKSLSFSSAVPESAQTDDTPHKGLFGMRRRSVGSSSNQAANKSNGIWKRSESFAFYSSHVHIEDIYHDNPKKTTCFGPPRYFVILHTSSLRRNLDILMAAFIIYIAFMEPFRLAYLEPGPQTKTCSVPPEEGVSPISEDKYDSTLNALGIVDLVIDVFFVINLVLNFRTTFVRQGVLVTSQRAIVRNYLFGKHGIGRFWLDFISSLPIILDIMQVAGVDDAIEGGFIRMLRLFRLSRLLRLHQLPPTARLNMYLSLVTNLLFVLLFGHWFGCLWFFMMKEEGFFLCPQDFGGDFYLILMYPSEENDEMFQTIGDRGLFFQFMRSWFWGLGNLLGLGSELQPNNNSWQVLVSILVSMVGLVLFATIVSNINEIFLKVNVADREQQEVFQYAKRFIRSRNLPPDLERKIYRYLEVRWRRSKGLDEDRLLSGFPQPLAVEIRVHLARQVMSGIGFFNTTDIEPDFILALVTQLKPAVGIENMKLIRARRSCSQVFFTERCRVLLKDRHGGSYGFLRTGGVFGFPLGKVKPTRHDQAMSSVNIDNFPITEANIFRFSVVLAHPCSMYVIDYADLDPILARFPDMRVLLEKQVAAQTIQAIWRQKLLGRFLRRCGREARRQWDGHGTFPHKMSRIVDSLLISQHVEDPLARTGSERSDTSAAYKAEAGGELTPSLLKSAAFDDVVAKEL